MSVLTEYYESGNAPHEALGRAARRLASGGALYLGGGVGIEKVKQGDAESYSVTQSSGGKAETFTGPLSAVIRAFALAGGATTPDSPGGATAVTDPAAAARLRELKDEEAEAEADIRRYEARHARRQRTAAAQPWSPGRVDDDAWELRRIEELKADLGRIRAERSKLLASGTVEEAEAGKPGTNWKQVSSSAKKKLSGILKHYRGMAHPFRQCVADNTKRFGQERAERICAVVKDLNKRSTKWRKGGAKVSEEADALIEAALGRLAVVEESFGLPAMVQLVEGVPDAPPAVRALAEGVGDDFALLALAGHPLALAAFGIEEAFREKDHPRDFRGRFTEKLSSAKVGTTIDLDGDVKVRKRPDGKYEVRGGGTLNVAQAAKGGPPFVTVDAPEKAAQLAVVRSLRSTKPDSLGGSTKYEGLHDFEQRHGGPKRAGSGPAAERRQITQALSRLTGVAKYSIVDGQGKSIGHVQVTDDGRGWEVTIRGKTETYGTPGGAALAVDRAQRQARANEGARQRRRAATLKA